MFEFEIEDKSNPVKECKKKLVLDFTEHGFNLTDEDGYVIVNASYIDEYCNIGINTGNVGKIHVSSPVKSDWGSPLQLRYNFQIS